MATVGVPALASALSVVALGCFSPAPPSGAPCDPLTPNCPRGQECRESGGGYFCLHPGESVDGIREDAGIDTLDDAAPGDAPDDAPPSNDRDGDGVLNAVDNCPDVANANQYNEDLDAYGDACDPCPPYPDALLLVDPDGDGVTGRCDPNPMTEGDRIFLFEGFAGGIPAGFTQTGQWAADGGTVTATAGQGNTALLRIAGPMKDETVMTELAIREVDFGITMSQFFVAGPVTRVDSDGGVGCSILDGLALDMRLILTNLNTGNAFGTNEDYTAELDAFYRLALTRDGNGFTCAVAESGADPTATVTGSLMTNPAIPGVGLRVRAGEVDFAWLLVVDRP